MTDLVIRELITHKEVHRVPLNSLNERHVERVMFGILRNMDTNNYFIDDSEVDRARKETQNAQSTEEEENER